MDPIVGGIYYVRDEKLTLHPESKREVHDTRRLVVVVSGVTTNNDFAWPFVLCCPISGSTTFKTAFCVKLAAGESGVQKKCWIRTPAVQPLMKDDLEDLAGVLEGPRLQELQARLVEYMGLLDEPDTSV